MSDDHGLPPDPDLDDLPPELAGASGPLTLTGIDRETGEVFEGPITKAALAAGLAETRRAREDDWA